MQHSAKSVMSLFWDLTTSGNSRQLLLIEFLVNSQSGAYLFGAYALRHRLDFWCCLGDCWFPLISNPQCSQVVEGTSLTQLEGRSPTSSRRAGSMPRAFWWRVSAGAVVTNPVSRQRKRRDCPLILVK